VGEGDMGCSDKGTMYYFKWGQNLSPLKGRGLKPSGGIPHGCYLKIFKKNPFFWHAYITSYTKNSTMIYMYIPSSYNYLQTVPVMFVV